MPPNLLTDGRQKYDFEPELFDDPALAKREESIANRVKYKVRRQQPVTATERRRANISKAFLAQLETRPTDGKASSVSYNLLGDSSVTKG